MSGRGFTSVFAADLDAYHGYPLEMIARGHVRRLPALGLLATIMRSPCPVHPLFTPHGRPGALIGAV